MVAIAIDVERRKGERRVTRGSMTALMMQHIYKDRVLKDRREANAQAPSPRGK